MFSSIFNSTEILSYNPTDIILCTVASVVLGLLIALIFTVQGNSSRSFRLTLVILPVLVQAVMMMVNGNLGTSVAVLGAFSLIRFRSIPGSSKDICGVFFAMAVGVANAMGCIGFACMLTVLVGIVLIVGGKIIESAAAVEKTLRITIPENLDYTEIFDDIFGEYTRKVRLESVKTTNLGSMFELCYRIHLKNGINEKEMIDKIRCKNGNLTVICSREVNMETL